MDAHSRAQVLVSGCARPGAVRGGEGRAHDHRVLTAGTSYARLPMWEMLSAAFLGVRTALNLGEGELECVSLVLSCQRCTLLEKVRNGDVHLRRWRGNGAPWGWE